MKLETHVHVHNDLSGSSAEILAAIESLRKSMAATHLSLKDTLDVINVRTNELSSAVDKVLTNDVAQTTLIQQLKDQLAAGSPVTQAQLDELQAVADGRAAALTAVRDALLPIAVDPVNPAPPIQPTPPVL